MPSDCHSSSDEEDCYSSADDLDDQDFVPPTPACSEELPNDPCHVFEVIGTLTIPTEQQEWTTPADSVLEYEPDVVVGEDAPEPYPKGFELTGCHVIPRDPEDATFCTELPVYTADPNPEDDAPVKNVDPYDKHAVKQALTKEGPEPEAFAVAVPWPRPKYHKGPRKVVTDPAKYLSDYTPVGTIYDADEGTPKVPSSCRIITNHPIDTPIDGVVDGAGKKPRSDPVVPDPYDKHAPRQGVLYDSVLPSRWSDCSSEPKLKDRARSDVFEVRYGDNFAFFRNSDADKVKALMALHSESTQASVNRDTLIRLRLNLAMSGGASVKDLLAMQQVAGMFHNALEIADDSIDSADLEACLEAWVLEPTRYAPFKDLGDAVDFMCLPVQNNRVLGMATKHRYAPALERSLLCPADRTVTNVTSTNMQLRSEPKAEFKRVSIWNEPAKHVDDNHRIPLEIDGSC